LHNVLIILAVISVPSVVSTWKNLPLKSMIYDNHVENVRPYWHVGDPSYVITLASKHHEY